jgi:outer membrane protein OmpA-like peptidoglycan-associated protein
MRKRIRIQVSSLLFMAIVASGSGAAFAAGGPDVQIQVAKPGATATVEQVISEGKVHVNVVDAGNQPVIGLRAGDFSVTEAGRPVKVTSVQPLSESKDVPRHFVLVLDNSFSMVQRNNAVEPLLAGVGKLLDTIRPIDDVRLVVFSDKKTVDMGGRTLHVQIFQSNKPDELQRYLAKVYKDDITGKTVLHEGMLAGLELLDTMPATEPRFMVVFTDGEDLNSTFTREDVLTRAGELKRFDAYAIDFMDRPTTDKFLTQFTSQNNGQIWKAKSKTNIVPIFQDVATRMEHSYVITYQLAPTGPPTGTLAVAPTSLTVEEIKTIDASPMLGQIFFDKGSSEIPSRYVRLAGPGETAGFDEQKFSVTLQKYYAVLNIIGKRLAEKPGSTITLVGCNDNTGPEKGNRTLSTQRAEAVRDYLKTVWNIAPERMTIQARNLPASPSYSQSQEGQAENRRVEITSTDQEILAPIRSTYLSTRIDPQTLTLRPDVAAPNGIASWKVTVANASGTLAELSGKGAPARELLIPLDSKDFRSLAAGGDLSVKMDVRDTKGQSQTLSADPVKLNAIQTSQRVAQKQGERIQEKYALILFEFNKDALGALNQEIVNRIAAHMKALPQATVDIVGHTDNTGSAAYNQQLSERRARAVDKLLVAAYGEGAGDRIHYSGVGEDNPPFDNLSPEAMAFNRTVIITLDYQSAD